MRYIEHQFAIVKGHLCHTWPHYWYLQEKMMRLYLIGKQRQ